MRNRLRALWRTLKTENSSPRELAISVFVGVFLGVVPLYGIQTAICLFAAWALRLNRLAVLSAAQISIPFFAPFLIAGGIAIGEFIRFGRVRAVDLAEAQGFIQQLWLLGGDVPDLFLSCLLGSVVLGSILGALAGGVVYRLAARDAMASEVARPDPLPNAEG